MSVGKRDKTPFAFFSPWRGMTGRSRCASSEAEVMDLLALRPVTLTWLRRQARARAGPSRGRADPPFSGWFPAIRLLSSFSCLGFVVVSTTSLKVRLLAGDLKKRQAGKPKRYREAAYLTSTPLASTPIVFFSFFFPESAASGPGETGGLARCEFRGHLVGENMGTCPLVPFKHKYRLKCKRLISMNLRRCADAFWGELRT